MRRLPLAFLGCVLGLASACAPTGEAPVVAQTDLSLTPHPARVGEAELELVLTDAAGQPLEAETLDVEGNMNHAGMKPVFTTIRQTAPGRFEGTLEFTMAGDWFLLVSGQLSDGRKVDVKIDVPGVQRP